MAVALRAPAHGRARCSASCPWTLTPACEQPGSRLYIIKLFSDDACLGAVWPLQPCPRVAGLRSDPGDAAREHCMRPRQKAMPPHPRVPLGPLSPGDGHGAFGHYCLGSSERLLSFHEKLIGEESGVQPHVAETWLPRLHRCGLHGVWARVARTSTKLWSEGTSQPLGVSCSAPAWLPPASRHRRPLCAPFFVRRGSRRAL